MSNAVRALPEQHLTNVQLYRALRSPSSAHRGVITAMAQELLERRGGEAPIEAIARRGSEMQEEVVRRARVEFVEACTELQAKDGTVAFDGPNFLRYHEWVTNVIEGEMAMEKMLLQQREIEAIAAWASMWRDA